jgi:putative FmdB family regulatory protein
MFYDFKCSKCEKITILMQSMSEELPNHINCQYCSGKAYRNWASVKIHIPENFKAMSDITGGDSYASSDNLKKTFSHSHPTGRGKIYY